MIDRTAQGIRSSRIAIGAAREEGRQPSHDGEYLALYYTPGETEWVLEDNGGVVATDDDPRPIGTEDDPQWEDVLAEIAEDIAKDRGTLARSSGREAQGLMEEMGWLVDDPENPGEVAIYRAQ